MKANVKTEMQVYMTNGGIWSRLEKEILRIVLTSDFEKLVLFGYLDKLSRLITFVSREVIAGSINGDFFVTMHKIFGDHFVPGTLRLRTSKLIVVGQSQLLNLLDQIHESRHSPLAYDYLFPGIVFGCFF